MAMINEWRGGAEFLHGASPVKVTVYKPRLSEFAEGDELVARIAWGGPLPQSPDATRDFAQTLLEAADFADKLNAEFKPQYAALMERAAAERAQG